MNVQQSQVTALLEPKSIAVIGASRDERSVGSTILKNIVSFGYKKKVYPVNPYADELSGLVCYPSVLSVDADIDLAIISVPASIVPTVLTECGKKHIKASIIISSGFKEIGDKGKNLELLIQKIASTYDIGILGPNCLGIINTNINLNASFARYSPSKGNVSLLSQSGALGSALLDMTPQLGFGISLFVSLGNQAGFTQNDILSYIETHEETKVVGYYCEEIREPKDFLRKAHAVRNSNKPIIVLKSGTTEEGEKAVSSHTGSLAGGKEIYNGLFTQAGCIHVPDIRSFMQTISICSMNPIPKGNHLGIITNAGGPGILATDTAISLGLTTSHKHAFTDLLGDASPFAYKKAFVRMGKSMTVDSILIIITPQSTTDVEGIVQAIIDNKNNVNKPIVVALMGHESIKKAQTHLTDNNIMAVQYPEEGVVSLSSLYQCSLWSKNKHTAVKKKTHICIPSLKTTVTEKPIYHKEALELLKIYGIPVQPYVFMNQTDDIKSKIKYVTKPVALKLLSPDVIHKKSSGCIRLSVLPSDIQSTVNKLFLLAKKNCWKIEGILCMEMADVKKGKEMIVGVKTDARFGKIIVVGMGGEFVEIIRDFQTGIIPINDYDAYRMIRKLTSITHIEKFDINALTDIMVRVSELVTDHPEIYELDINPILLSPDKKHTVALDGRFTLTD